MKPAKILVVDDEEIMVILLGSFLQRFACTISTAADAHEAIQLLKKTTFDLVITDLQLGETNGLEVVLSAKELSPKTLVFMMSGCHEAEHVLAAFRNGADDYLLKPFPMALLLERLQHKGLRLKEAVQNHNQCELQHNNRPCQKYLHPVKKSLYT